jgi:hypothetical protein
VAAPNDIKPGIGVSAGALSNLFGRSTAENIFGDFGDLGGAIGTGTAAGALYKPPAGAPWKGWKGRLSTGALYTLLQYAAQKMLVNGTVDSVDGGINSMLGK